MMMLLSGGFDTYIQIFRLSCFSATLRGLLEMIRDIAHRLRNAEPRSNSFVFQIASQDMDARTTRMTCVKLFSGLVFCLNKSRAIQDQQRGAFD